MWYTTAGILNPQLSKIKQLTMQIMHKMGKKYY